MTVDQVNLDEWYFQGGIKSASGKNRIVPIHDRIKPLVKNLVNQGNTYLFSYDGKNSMQPLIGIMSGTKCWNRSHQARHHMKPDTRLKHFWMMLKGIGSVSIC